MRTRNKYCCKNIFVIAGTYYSLLWVVVVVVVIMLVRDKEEEEVKEKKYRCKARNVRFTAQILNVQFLHFGHRDCNH